jgi:hypothetical protein
MSGATPQTEVETTPIRCADVASRGGRRSHAAGWTATQPTQPAPSFEILSEPNVCAVHTSLGVRAGSLDRAGPTGTSRTSESFAGSGLASKVPRTALRQALHKLAAYTVQYRAAQPSPGVRLNTPIRNEDP